MISTETALDNLTLNIQTEIQVRATLETTFEALLEELSSSLTTEARTQPSASLTSACPNSADGWRSTSTINGWARVRTRLVLSD